jgi:hypothetical protein
MKAQLPLLLALGAGLSGCATVVDSNAIPASAPAGTPVDGIPYHQPAQFDVELYKKTPSGYSLVAKNAATLADPTHVAVLTLRGDVLANSTVKVGLSKDSKLTSLDVQSQSQAATSLTDIGKAAQDEATAAATAKATKAQARTAAAAEASTALTTAAQGQITVAQATSDANVAQKELDELPTDALPSVRAKKAGEVLILKMKANEAARQAGVLTKPFPDV